MPHYVGHHIHGKPGPGEAHKLRRPLLERLDLRQRLRRDLRELALCDLVAGSGHRLGARALRACRRHACDAPPDGEQEGPTPTKQLEPPGFMALNYGRRTPIAVILARLVYGTILGIFCRLK
jgi:hypothetical protein